MSRKDSIDSLFLKKPGAASSSVAKSPDRVRTGAISAMGVSLQEMTEAAKQATKLQKQLDNGEAVISIDPELIEVTGVADRISIDVDPQFDALVESIREHGQQIPILVRQSPNSPDHFQIAYGRRRLKAISKLGRPIQAIVRDLSDSELIIAQGRENLDRKDLSFIEKAFFAKNLEDDGCSRQTIISALASDKSDVSRYVNIARQVPEELVKHIGPAPKAGRARWMTLVERLGSSENRTRANGIAGELSRTGLDSDARLVALLKALSVPQDGKSSRAVEGWMAPSGKCGMQIESYRRKTSLVFDEMAVPEFALFISRKLDELYVEFEKSNQKGENK